MHKYADDELARAAGRVWTLGRANPIQFDVRTPLGTFTTDDRSTWHSRAGTWTAELRRSRNGRHTFLALFKEGVYQGRYDATGWHAATDRKRVRHLRSYQLPLVA